ncbi:MAG: FMN-binding protein [Planctomycetes bacterium]|nr:FMN-binding protein [Planctomycetota bacterium]
MKLIPAALATLLLLQGALAAQQPAPRKTRTRAEVEDLIKRQGATAPDWFKTVKPNAPKTLDLSWPKNPGGAWDQSKNVGQYIWSVINENPSRWKEGVRFMHELMSTSKDKTVVRRAMYAAARMYHNLLEDYPRAAFWWRKAGEMKEGDEEETTLDLADTYWELGCREMAVELIDGYGADNTRHGSIIKLWSDMGEFDRAMKMAEARGGYVGFLCAGDACRAAQKFDEAVAWYEKVVALGKSDQGDEPRIFNRAQANIVAVKLFEALDLRRVRPGTWKADSLGYEAPVEVEVKVAGGRITSVKVTAHREKQFYSSLTETPRRIVEKQGVKGVDATTGATITSEAILNATAKALNQGMVKQK